MNAVSVSMDQKRILCGTYEGASVWDAKTLEKVTEVEGKNEVFAVDVSPDSTRFATGPRTGWSIWTITNGERLVGPLGYDDEVNGIKFSPDGEHIATACSGASIHIFDGHDGVELITIQTISLSTSWMSYPLAWLNDGKQIFAVLKDKKIKSFDVSTGFQLAES